VVVLTLCFAFGCVLLKMTLMVGGAPFGVKGAGFDLAAAN
jgi:hypothetical protein